ncbi:MAG: NrfD/PsrC family molybdoenzyme membrane anchor subunit [Syntrophaceticus sp.]|jgi:polysulfide reductase chain C
MPELQTSWGWLIAVYLFLAGISAGAYISAFVSWSKFKGDNLITRVGLLIAAPCLGLSILFLFFDLEKPAQFMNAFLRPYSSMISVGTWVLTIFFVVCAYQWLKCITARDKTLKESNVVWFVGFIFAVLAAFYTGVLLWEMRGIPFWNSVLIPLLFLASAISTGIGAVLIGATVYRSYKQDVEEDAVNLHFLYKLDLVIIVVEAVILLAYLLIMGLSSHPAAVNSVQMLLTGSLAPVFWIVFIVVGLVLPFYLEWSLCRNGVNKHLSSTIAASCLLIGGLTLRYLILSAGTFSTFRLLL